MASFLEDMQSVDVQYREENLETCIQIIYNVFSGLILALLKNL